jgi:hypothetical protein
MSERGTRNPEGRGAERGTRSDRLRALNVPRAIAVELDDAGLPVRIREGGTGKGEGWRAVEGIGDTWRLDDEWWRRPIARRYVELILEQGGRMVVYEDLMTGEWYAQ